MINGHTERRDAETPGRVGFLCVLPVHHVLRDTHQPSLTGNEQLHCHTVQHLHPTGHVVTERVEDRPNVIRVRLLVEFDQITMLVVLPPEQSRLRYPASQRRRQESLLTHLVIHVPRFVLPLFRDCSTSWADVLLRESSRGGR